MSYRSRELNKVSQTVGNSTDILPWGCLTPKFVIFSLSSVQAWRGNEFPPNWLMVGISEEVHRNKLTNKAKGTPEKNKEAKVLRDD